MAYPPAPWTLKGYAVQLLRLVDNRRARPFVPPELHIVSIVPGKTLGVVYLATYGPGSALEYSELIVAPALTRYGRTLGFWVSHIYVDNADSVAGGREIWGLPKEPARFSWEQGEGTKVTVRQGERLLCTLHCGRQRWLWRQPLLVPALSRLDADLLWFKGTIAARLGLARGSLEVPAESPFAALELRGVGRTYHHRDMTFVASAPRGVGRSANAARA